MSTTFAQLGVPSFISDALARRQITEPFEIQAVTITDMLAGRDVCGRAPTGSGKTLAFGVPAIANTQRAEPRRPQALILAPTRELAEQITTELRTFAGRLRVDAVYGGVGYGHQLSALRRGVDVLVACPGRLEDLIERGDVRLDHVRLVVLDEADRMADMGFMPAVRRLLAQTPAERQTVLFSATLDGDVAKLTRDFQRDPVRHEVGPETTDVRAAHHVFWKVDRDDRNDLLADVVRAAWPSMIFCRTRHGADRLVKQLGRLDVECVAIHGGLAQNQRNRALESFSSGRVHALVATDVAAAASTSTAWRRSSTTTRRRTTRPTCTGQVARRAPAPPAWWSRSSCPTSSRTPAVCSARSASTKRSCRHRSGSCPSTASTPTVP